MNDFVRGKLGGYLRRDDFGRVFVDTCETDKEHLLNKHGCRKYLTDILVPEELLGKNVRISFEIRFTTCTEN